MHSTSAPSPSSRSHRCEPMKPAPPVTSTRFSVPLIGAHYASNTIAPPEGDRSLKFAAILLKIAATAALLWFVFSKVDVAQIAARVSAAQIALALCAGVAVLSLQAYLVALRLR